MTLLALDLGQNVGWVRGSVVGPMTFGTFEMVRSTNLGKWLASFDPFVRKHFSGVTAIAVEQPFLGENYFAARKLIALLGAVHYWSSFYPIGVVNEIAVSSGKLNLSGLGNADAERMIRAAKDRYGLDMDEHQAHALGIWDVHHLGKMAPIPKARSRSSKGVVVKA